MTMHKNCLWSLSLPIQHFLSMSSSTNSPTNKCSLSKLVFTIWGCNHGNFFQGINHGNVPEGAFRRTWQQKKKRPSTLAVLTVFDNSFSFSSVSDNAQQYNSHWINDFVEPTKVCAEGSRPCREVQISTIWDEDAQLHFACQLHCVHPWGLNAFNFISSKQRMKMVEVPAGIATWMHSFWCSIMLHLERQKIGSCNFEFASGEFTPSGTARRFTLEIPMLNSWWQFK